MGPIPKFPRPIFWGNSFCSKYRLVGCPDRRSGMPGSFSTVIAHMEPPSSRKQAKRARLGPERPFLGPWRSSECPVGQIWSQLPPIGPPGLNSWSTHTLSWYRAPFGPKGALKGLVLAPKDPFGDLGGPRRAPVGQIWSQSPSNGLMGLNLWSPQTLT